MKRKDSVRYEMLVRVQAFGDSHKDTFPGGSIGGQAFAAVAAAVAQLSHYALDKIASKREGVRMKAAARKAVSDWLDEIARTARVIAQATPGFDDPFVVARQRRADQALLDAGRVFAREAERAKREFVAHGLPETFLDELTGAVAALDRAIRRREEGRIGQTAAQVGIDAAIASGLEAARKLDVIVRNQYRSDPVTRAVWRTQRRIGRASRPSVAAAVAEAPVPTPAPATMANSGPAAAEPARPGEAVDLKVAS